MSVIRIKKGNPSKKINDWRDPLYLNNLLTKEEKIIHKKAKDFCKNYLMPSVIENNEKNFFDKKIYPSLGSNGFLGNTINGYGSANVSSVAYGLVARELEAVDSSYRSTSSIIFSYTSYIYLWVQ